MYLDFLEVGYVVSDMLLWKHAKEEEESRAVERWQVRVQHMEYSVQ